jgi:hypothetical protein
MQALRQRVDVPDVCILLGAALAGVTFGATWPGTVAALAGVVLVAVGVFADVRMAHRQG